MGFYLFDSTDKILGGNFKRDREKKTPQNDDFVCTCLLIGFFLVGLVLVKYFSIKFLLEQPIPNTNTAIVFVGVV